MSDLTTILLMMATFGLMMLCVVLLFVVAHRRMDEIVTGIVNGVPISKKYRSLLPFYDYVGYVALGLILLMIFAVGFHEAADIAANQKVGALANFCAVVCAAIAVGIVVLATVMFLHMLSAVRQT